MRFGDSAAAGWLLGILAGPWAQQCHGFRILPSENDPMGASPAVFQPYVRGEVGYYGDPTSPNPERVNEGGPFSPDTPRIYMHGTPKQNCPGMVGPINEEEYYCHSRTFGYCDRRTGLCVCNEGYTGIDCTACTPSYYSKGGLCYRKKSCPKDCSRAGKCDYETGTCSCALNRGGDDCSQVYCHFDAKCLSCTSTKCTSCIEGYFVDPDTQTCESCQRYDPRCLVCDHAQCLECADPILNSIRRSGARNIDPELPFDELVREFSFTFSYGSQDARVFDEAELFHVVPFKGGYLNDTSQKCVQGTQSDASWACQPVRISHRVCGHNGVFSFSSPIYAVTEAAGNILLNVRRSGGGVGSAYVDYDLHHITTTSNDVSPTAFYTSLQRLYFPVGVVELSFLVTIHDNHDVDDDKAFRIRLRSPSDGSSLGNQREAHVTVWDDDTAHAVANLTHVTHACETMLMKKGYVGESVGFQVQAVLGDGNIKPTGGDQLHVESYNTDESDASAAYHTRISGVITDNANGTYTCEWQRNRAGIYNVAVYMLYPGGLRGDFYAGSWGGDTGLTRRPAITSRVDRHLNFTWKSGPIVSTVTDYATVRWKGRLKSKVTGEVTIYVKYDDHVRIWLDDVLLIDRWSFEHDGGGTAQATTYMDSTTLSPFIVEYRELAGDAHIYLYWSASSVPKEVIPASQLYSEQHIRGSPFTDILILPAQSAHPVTTYLKGPLTAVAGTSLTMQLFPVDAYANAKATHNPIVDHYDVTLTLITDHSDGGQGSKQVTCDLVWERDEDSEDTRDHSETFFVVMCVPFFSGVHHLVPSVNGVAISGSPFVVLVTPNRLHPTQSVLSGSGVLANQVANESAVILMQSRDLNRNRIYSSDVHLYGTVLAVRAIHTYPDSNEIAVDTGTVRDNNDGTYTLTYTPRFIGEYQIHVTQNGVHVNNSPYKVSVEGQTR